MTDKDAFDPTANSKKGSAQSGSELTPVNALAAMKEELEQEKENPYDGLSFAPQTIVNNAYQIVEDRAATPHVGVKTGIGVIDKDFLPMRPGELCGVLGFTSNGKSALMNFIARNHALKIKGEGEIGKKVAINVTYEQSIEEQGVIDMAQIAKIDVSRMMRGEMDAEEWRGLRRAGVERGKLPWWLIGHSSLQRNRRPHLTMSELYLAIERIIERQKLLPELIVVDYLQRIPGEKGIRERRERFVDIVDRSKDMALAFGCPVLLGCQAGRQVKERTWQLPQLEDAQETSNFEQSCDKVLSVWMPKTAYPVGHVIDYGEQEFTVTENLLIGAVLKQKFGPAPRIYDLFIKPEVNQLYGTAKEAN